MLFTSLVAASDASEETLSCVETTSTMDGEGLLPHIIYFWDRDGAIKAPDSTSGFKVTASANDYSFKHFVNPGDIVQLKHTDSNHWFRFCLHNSSDQTHNLVAAFEPASLSEVDFYPQKRGLRSYKTGNTKAMSTRDIPNPHFDFHIRLTADETQTFYLRINADLNPSLHAQLWDRTSYDNNNNQNESRWGIYVGVFIGLVIYHLLLFFSVRQSTSLLFIIWSTSIFILLSSLDGRLVQYLFPDHQQLNRLGAAIFYPASIFLSAAFFRNFIKINNYPELNRVGNGLLALSALVLVLAYSHNPITFAKALDGVAVIITCYFGLLVPIYTLIKYRLEVAKYIIFSLTPLLVVLVDRTLFSLEISNEYFVPYKLQVAAVCAMIIISYYIGLMVYRDKQSAQRVAMEQLNISNTLKSNYNTQLEQELEQKTSDIRSMNADLEQQAKKLLQLDESKSKFFANISHEFRTPLTLIEGPLNLLLETDGAAKKIVTDKATIEDVVKHSNSLKRLIDQILVLSELDENALHLKATRLNVVQMVQEFTAQFDSIYKQKGVELSCEASQENIKAYVDVEKLQIILNNLLSNAIKFTEAPGYVRVKVSATTLMAEPAEGFTSDEYVQITVSDSGHGIQESEVNHVFDRYFQSENSDQSKSGQGTGIGLALVKELTELHAGSVEVESVYQVASVFPDEGFLPAEGVSSGSIFRITLPLGRVHLTDNEIVSELTVNSAREVLLPAVSSNQDPLESEQTRLAQISVSERFTVLVVDDNSDMRHHISRLLEADFNIITANDGLLAEEELKKFIPDLIITDLMMPNRNGLEFVQSIKLQDKFAHIPIIMLTARAGLHDRIKGLMAAVDDYLIKPFDGRELKARIHNLLNKQAQFDAFYQAKIETSSVEPSRSYIDKVIAIVNERLGEADFGVEELAQALHVSEATLRRRLSEQAKFSPAAFIRHCRLEKARQLSIEGNMRTIAELALAVGFKQPDYFARLYKKTFNTSVELSVTSKGVNN